MALIRHFAKEFDEKHMAGKGSVLDHPKAVAKLRKQVRRAPAPALHCSMDLGACAHSRPGLHVDCDVMV
jgi:hypothetical protein